MESILTIIAKDVKQLLRDFKSFLFMLIMPIAFTFLFGLAFSGTYDADKDSRLSVGYLNLDRRSEVSQDLVKLLDESTVVKIVEGTNEDDLMKQLEKEKHAAVMIIPSGYGSNLIADSPAKVTLYADTTSTNGLTAQTEIGTQVSRLLSAIHVAQTIAPDGGDVFDTVLADALKAWKNPPVQLVMNQTSSINSTVIELSGQQSSYAHSSPAMILQFAVAGLLTCAQIIIMERKSRCLQRMMTTATTRVKILLGHYFAIVFTLLLQFIILIVFGDLVLKLDYHTQLGATIILSLASVLCIAALGLLIGVIAKGEEQGISFSLIAMFVLSAFGGAWVPLEVTGKTFQTIGHVSPLAWSMDGFNNILVRGQGFTSVLLPVAALLGYGILFFALAALRFRKE